MQTPPPAAARFTYLPPDRLSCWPAAIAAAASQPLILAARNWRQEAPFMAALFFLILLFYGATTPSSVALEDDALFIANLHFFGVAHPPGYPAHTFLGGIFYHLLPFGAPAFKAHLFSAFMGAAACTALYAIVALLVQGRLFPAAAALAFAVSKTFWSQSIIAEVYTLNAFLFFLLLALAMVYVGAPRPPRRLLFAMAIVTGVGLANHYPLFLLGGIGVALLTLPRMPRKFSSMSAAAAIAVATALPFYLWMVWRSHLPLPANFYAEPIDTLEKFRFYLLREGYSSIDQQAGADWSDKAEFAKHFAQDLLWQFTPAGAFFAAAGFFVMARTRYQWLWFCLLCGFLASSAALLALLNFELGYIALSVFRVYYLLAYGIMAIWLALGAAACVDLLTKYPILWRRGAGAGIIALVVCASVFAHWTLNNRANYTWAEDLARAKLQSVEPNAVLFLADDLDLPTYYLHTLLDERPDLAVYSDQGLILPNRLFSPLLPQYPPAHAPQSPSRAGELHKFIAQEIAPIYYNSNRFALFTSAQFGSELLGFYRRVNRASPAYSVALHDSVRDWLRQNLSDQQTQTDPWTRFQQYETISQVMNAVVQAEQEGAIALTNDWRDIIQLARQKNAKTRVLTNFIMLDNMTREQLSTEADWLAGFDLSQEHLMDKFGRGRFYLLRARLAQLLHGEEHAQYEQNLLAALSADERPENPGLGWLLDHYAAAQQHCDYLALIERYYPDINAMPQDRLAQLRAVRKTASHC